MKSLSFFLISAYKARLRLDKKQKKEISLFYINLLNDLEREIEKLPPLSQDTTISDFAKRTQLQQIELMLIDAMKNIGVAEHAAIKRSMQEICEIVTEANKNFMKEVGFPKEIISRAYQSVPNRAVERVVTGQLYKQPWSLSGTIWKDVRKNQQAIQEIVAKGIALNKSSYEIAKDLETFVDPNSKKPWDWGKVYPNSNKKIDYNAQRLARTMVSHAYQQAFEEEVDPMPFVEGVQWHTAHNGKQCDICLERETQNDYNLGKGVYPKGQVPLDHPNGMCFLTTVQPEPEDIAKRIRAWIDGASDGELDTYAREIDPDWDK